MTEHDTMQCPLSQTDLDDLTNLSFEKALAELETIVAQLEQGKINLEDSIKIYERGELLRRHCDKLLTIAESRVEKITTKAGTTPTTENFNQE